MYHQNIGPEVILISKFKCESEIICDYSLCRIWASQKNFLHILNVANTSQKFRWCKNHCDSEFFCRGIEPRSKDHFVSWRRFQYVHPARDSPLHLLILVQFGAIGNFRLRVYICATTRSENAFTRKCSTYRVQVVDSDQLQRVSVHIHVSLPFFFSKCSVLSSLRLIEA